MVTEILARERDLAALFQQASLLDKDQSVNLSMKSGIALFLCIRTYAYFELSLVDILRNYINSAQCDPVLAQFAGEQLGLRRRRNFTREEMLDLIGYFSSQWRSSIQNSTRGQLGDSLNSVVNNRNKIAHGELRAVGLTIGDVDSYYQYLQQILRLVYSTCV